MESIQTQLFRVAADAPDAEIIRQAAQILQAGGLVAFPTETVYGLGANALDARAVSRIYHAKGRPSNNPLIVHVPDVAGAMSVVSAWPDMAARLAERFWPGPLTLVLPKRDGVPDVVTGGGPTVGVRVPAHPVALALLQAARVPVAAPSANRSLQLSPTRAAHVLAGLDGRIEAILDGGPAWGGLESTVLNLTTTRPTLLRPGLISPAEIESAIGPISRRVPVPREEEANAPLPAPGLLSRHYAPRALLEIVLSGSGRVEELLNEGHIVGWLTADVAMREGRHAIQGKIDTALQAFSFSAERQDRLHTVGMPTDPEAYAAALYHCLHELDAKGVTRIVVDRLPDTEAWLAIRDRLNRAATPSES